MIKIRKELRNIPFSKLREIVEKIGEIEKRENVKVIKFIVGSPDFDIPLNVKQAVKNSLDRPKMYVPSNWGFDKLRELIVKKVTNKNNIHINNLNNVLVTVGSCEGIGLALFTILNPGDEVLIADPSWPYYEQIAKMIGAKTIFYPLRFENNFIPDTAEIEKCISKKTKMIIVNTPHNPTGAVFGKETLEEIANLAKKYNLVILSDEAYEYIIYDNEEHYSIASLPDMFERTITTFSFSKSHAMLPWRIGYVVTSSEILETFVKIHQYTLISVDTLSQYGAISALKDSDSENTVEYMLKEYGKRRSLILEGINNCKHLSCCIPKGTFYVFPKVDTKTGMNGFEFVNYLLEEAKVAVAPGFYFGQKQGENHIRISYAVTLNDIKKGVQQMQNALKKI